MDKLFMKSYRDKRTRENYLSIFEGALITVYDTETTGINHNTDEVVQFAAIQYEVKDGLWVPVKDAQLNQFIKPKKPIPPEVTAINHISNEDVADKPTLEEAIDLITAIMDADFWCGHNILGFDNQFMKRIYDDAGIELPDGFFHSLDTLDGVVDLIDHKECGKYNLGSMCQYFDIKESTDGTAGFHDALYDVRQDAELAKVLYKMYQQYEVPEEPDYIDKKLVPVIKRMYPYKAFPKAYTTGNYLMVITDVGTARYDKYQQTWSWSAGSPTKKVGLQAVIEAVYAKYGFNSDTELIFWKPEADKPKMSKSDTESYLSHPTDWPITFGKYKGETLGKIAASPEGKDYLEWMVTSDWLNDPTRETELSLIKCVLV